MRPAAPTTGQENLRPAGDVDDPGFALDGNDWDSIYVGRRRGNDLIYAGKVDHGFDKTSAAELRKCLTPLIRKTRPTPRRSRTRRSGLSPSCSPRSSTARSPPRVRCDTPSPKDCGRYIIGATQNPISRAVWVRFFISPLRALSPFASTDAGLFG
jgi:hypothetical protein